jgi:hypothetical protein
MCAQAQTGVIFWRGAWSVRALAPSTNFNWQWQILIEASFVNLAVATLLPFDK